MACGVRNRIRSRGTRSVVQFTRGTWAPLQNQKVQRASSARMPAGCKKSVLLCLVLLAALRLPCRSKVHSAGGWELEVGTLKKLINYFKQHPTKIHAWPGASIQQCTPLRNRAASLDAIYCSKYVSQYDQYDSVSSLNGWLGACDFSQFQQGLGLRERARVL